MKTFIKGALRGAFMMFLICSVLISAKAANEHIHASAEVIFLDEFDDPITDSLDIRVSLWGSYQVRSGDVDGSGEINPSALHYGGYQTEDTITPNESGYYSLEISEMPSLPVISPFNAFLQLEYKAENAPDTDYVVYDFVDDPPFQSVSRFLLDQSAVYYVTEAGPRTSWNSFTLDANNDAPTSITLQFGETLAKTLKYTLSTTQFEFDDDVSITGGITATASVDFSGASAFFTPQGAADPGTCSVGQQFYNTSSNALKVCNATDTWTALTAGQRSYGAVGSPAFNNSRTPSTTNDTFVIASVTMVVDNDETSTITAQVDTGSGFVTIATVGHDFDVTGLAVGGVSTSRQTMSFVVPPNAAYRIVSSGTAANTLNALQEISL